MTTYLQSTSEINLYLCILNGLWGSSNNKLSRWKPEDQLIISVHRELAALFTVTGNPFHSDTTIWPDNLYSYRIPIRLEKIIGFKDRYLLSNPDTRQILVKYHTASYGVALSLNAAPLHEEAGKLLIRHIRNCSPWADFNLENELKAIFAAQSSTIPFGVADKVELDSVRTEVPEHEASEHTQMQYYIAQLGRSLHYKIWIPKADQGRSFNGLLLRDLSEFELPRMSFNENAQGIISRIDTIWLKDDNPAELFEVEHTTSVYSGLLRMADLIAVIPTLKIGMYICAPLRRKNKVKDELYRPIFAKREAPLAQSVRFISFEGLAEFMKVPDNYRQHFNASILNELSELL